MSEMRKIDCPTCGAANHPLGIVNEAEQYRCHSCGMVYYGPAGCDEPRAEGAAESPEEGLPEAWDMTTPPPGD